MFWKALKNLICVCSLLLCSLAFAVSDEIEQFRQSIQNAASPEELSQALENAPEAVKNNEFLGVESYQADIEEGFHNWEDLKSWFLDELEAFTLAHGGGVEGELTDPKQTASEILDSQVFTDAGAAEERNWLSRLGQHIADGLQELFGRAATEPLDNAITPDIGWLGGLGQIIYYLAWVIIIAAIALVLFFVFRHFQVGGKKRRVGGILEEDDPERTADEWLEQANALEADGRFREAIRCLYLACLMRFDDANIARFIWHETNWEHLYRFEASPKRPEGLGFREPTQQFDLVWYGKDVATREEYLAFRDTYLDITKVLEGVKAA